jgi:hypothetical protein
MCFPEGGYSPVSWEASVLAGLDTREDANPRRKCTLPSDKATKRISSHPAKQDRAFYKEKTRHDVDIQRPCPGGNLSLLENRIHIFYFPSGSRYDKKKNKICCYL